MNSSAADGHRIRLPQPWRESVTESPAGLIATFSRRFHAPTGLADGTLLRLEIDCLDGWPLTVQLNGVRLTPTLPTAADEPLIVPLQLTALAASNDLVISFGGTDPLVPLACAPDQPLFGRRFLKACALVIS